MLKVVCRKRLDSSESKKVASPLFVLVVVVVVVFPSNPDTAMQAHTHPPTRARAR